MRRLTATFLLLAAAAEAPADATVTTVDGKAVTGVLVGLGPAKALLRVGKADRSIDLAQVRSIAFAGAETVDALARAGQQVICAVDGSVLAVADVAVGEGKVVGASAALGRLSIALEKVARIFRPRAHERPADMARRLEALHLRSRDDDVFVVADDSGAWTTVAGVLGSLDGRKVRLTYEDSDIEMDAGSVAVIEMAAASGRGQVRKVSDSAPAGLEPQPAGRLLCSDGSRLAFSALRLEGEVLELTGSAAGALRVRAEKVAEIRFRGAGEAYLDDLKPASVRQVAFFDESFGLGVGRTVAGGALRLGGRSYSRGLGLHARCILRYELGGAYRLLTMLAGIDDSVRAGAALLTISVDGKPVVEAMRLDRAEAPRAVRVDLAAARSMTILVDFAPRTFGIGARVDLCDAILSK